MPFLLRFHEFYQNFYDFHGFRYDLRLVRVPAAQALYFHKEIHENHRIFDKIHENEAKTA